MDYKELADLIFPNAKPIEYYEKMYPERNLPEGAIVTRYVVVCIRHCAQKWQPQKQKVFSF